MKLPIVLIALAIAILTPGLVESIHAQSWETIATVDDHINVSGGARISASPTGLLLATTTHVGADGNSSSRVSTSSDHGVTWNSIPADLSGFQPGRIVFSRAGDAVALGWGTGSLAKSTNGGVNWAVANTPGFHWSGVAGGVTVDPSGQIWVAGDDSAGGWNALRSSDGGATWSTIGHVPEGSARTITASSSAVVVSGRSSAGWTTWRSEDNGTNWTEVDTFELTSPNLTVAHSAAVDQQSRFYVAGQALAGSDPRWIVRGSSDGGLTWATLDDFYENPPSSKAVGVAVDLQGQVFVVGYSLGDYSGPQQPPPWRVRASSDGGQSWSTVDQVPSAGNYTWANAFDVTSDAVGNLFVIGSYHVGSGGVDRAIVRRLSGPPQLLVSWLDGSLELVWPTNATGLVLQSATTLGNGGDWQDATNAHTEINGQKVVTITPTGPGGFFRLRGP